MTDGEIDKLDAKIKKLEEKKNEMKDERECLKQEIIQKCQQSYNSLSTYQQKNFFNHSINESFNGQKI